MPSRLIARIALVTLALLAPLQAHAQGSSFKVIVNASNPLESITKADLNKFFLRKSRLWPKGGLVEPVDQPDGSSAKQTFCQHVLGRSVSAMAAYWQQQVFAGRGVPPVVKASDADVVAYVSTTPTAIGYVSAGASTGAGVKVIRIQD